MSTETDTNGSFSGTVTARICPACGHHELGVVDEAGRFRPLRPGDRVRINATREIVSKACGRFPRAEESSAPDVNPTFVPWAPAPVMPFSELRKKYGVMLPEEAPEVDGPLYLEAYARKLESLIEKESEASRAILLDRFFTAAHLAGGSPATIAQAMWRELDEVRAPAELVIRWMDHPDEACLSELLGSRAKAKIGDEPGEVSIMERELEDLTLAEFLDLL
ncbi:MAG: hypothetical protein JRJ35_04210 [Deltaproteobacteria bacterium]|nr:hypothetical protein [Deltaproteobacteria bacterium]MBW1922656.1 hypothetical protein [Deltaproteobacteria bacterium]MBW1948727.1 hypothetical protein [Deltaproteobacteria bacterium]MBW2007627.1 hypothetical protein [Deltaproteobacteria bacterium]MBW2103444.1 hypothetical protein [Deltaproteobacteria bacterium]